MKSEAILFLCITLFHMKMLATSTFAATRDFGGGERDRVALLAFKSKIKHDPKGAMSTWNNSLHFCEWQGITCGRRHQRVVVLDLDSKGLVGTLSPYIGNLSFLREMMLPNNNLHGKIPSEVGRLFRLEVLRLSFNSFEGEIPADISHCFNLVTLWIADNKLVGKFPEELGSLSKLKVLSIAQNNLTGGIPSSIGNLTSLESFSAAFNKFGGSIPDVFHRLINLSELGLTGNELSGTVPPSIYNLSLLTILSFPENQLHGNLPPNFGLLFPYLQNLQIRNNYFTGPIPSSLSNASELKYVEMDANNFAGKVSVNFRGLQHLSRISMTQNNLGTGDVDELKFLNSLLNCSNLEVMRLNRNHFGGALPNTIHILSTQISTLDLSDNQISGHIPSWFGTLTNLTYLAMYNNQLIGRIPGTIGKLQKLNRLYLRTNRLSGEIPSSLGNLSSLVQLSLRDNTFQGTIPSSLGNCQKLLFLILSRNSLSGTIPKQLFNISSLVILRVTQNQLDGLLPTEVGNLKNLGELIAYENKLSGQIPSSLGDCSSLEYLYLEGNSFSGSIPQSLISMRGIQEIDLSCNNLSGEIPNYLETFSLTYLNLSFNDFEGEIPTKGVFGNATAISVLGNTKLCGGISELKLSSCSTKESKKQDLSSLVIIFISIASILLGLTLVSSFVFFWFKKKRKEQSSGSIKTLWKTTYTMLLKATDSFSATNLIGVGSFGTVYKGILDQDEKVVAIKVLNLQRRGAVKSFMTECEALRNIRHRNLVKIITCCSSVDFHGNDFKALVYEFMLNGSLERWLHPFPESCTNQDDQVQILSFHHRINIANDTAYALDYLHHHCQPPIVHCDLKPSNILLDGDMVTHVGDFGLAKFLEELTPPIQSSSIGVRGTIGYAAPEYGLGSEASTSGDVYSYGILLLEMMTGKKPTNTLFEEDLNLHKFSSLALPDRVMEIVDPSLLNGLGEADEECLISMVKIGVACSMESPQNRMDMKDVLLELQLIKTTLQGTRRRSHIHA